MEVIKKYYGIISSLSEFVQFHVQDFSATQPLQDFISSSVVACSAETNMWLKPDEVAKDVDNSNLDELLELVIANAAKRRDMQGNLLSRGFDKQIMGKITSLCHNNMVAFFRRPVMRELHRIIGSRLMLHLMRNLSLFVKNQSCYTQITGYPINNINLSSKVKEKGQNGKSK
jgi:hypothetical protein